MEEHLCKCIGGCSLCSEYIQVDLHRTLPYVVYKNHRPVLREQAFFLPVGTSRWVVDPKNKDEASVVVQLREAEVGNLV